SWTEKLVPHPRDSDEHSQSGILTSGLRPRSRLPGPLARNQWLWEFVGRNSGATVPDSHGVPKHLVAIDGLLRLLSKNGSLLRRPVRLAKEIFSAVRCRTEHQRNSLTSKTPDLRVRGGLSARSSELYAFEIEETLGDLIDGLD